MTQNSSEGRNLKVLERGFEIIELVSDQPGLTLTELAEELDVPKSTAHIYLQTLEGEGYLVNDGGYQVSLKFLTIGGKRRSRTLLYEAAKEPAAELADNLDKTFNVGMGFEERGKRILIDKFQGQKSPFVGQLGHCTNLHWVASGKALLAKFPRDRVEEIIDRHGLPRATENTITEPDALFEEIDDIREQGYALEDEERIEGFRSIAVPIEGKEQNQYGSLTIAGPKHELADDRLPEFVDRLSRAANIAEITYKNY